MAPPYPKERDLSKKMKVLVVEHDHASSRLLSAMISSYGYQVRFCDKVEQAQEFLRTETFDLVISEVSMPGDLDGFELLKFVRNEMPSGLPFIMLSVDSSKETVMNAVFLGASGFIAKPVRPRDLQTIWKYALTNNGNNDQTIRQYALRKTPNNGNDQDPSPKRLKIN